MKHFSLLATLLLATNAIWAYDFKSGDLYYNITSSTSDLKVEVTCTDDGAAVCYKGLTSVIVPATVEHDSKTYTVTAIGQKAFSECETLTTVTLPSTITVIDWNAFDNCTGLTSINLPEGLTTIGQHAFSDTSIPSITLPSSLTTIGTHAFWGCNKLTEIAIPGSVAEIPYQAFHGCTALTTVTLNDGITGIGANAFFECTSLSTINFPVGLKTIGDLAFIRCENLNAITLPDGLESIGQFAFDGCGMFNVVVPNSVTSIGGNAFNNCKNVEYKGSASGAPWGAYYVNAYIENDIIYSDDTKKTLLLASRTISGDVVIPDGVETIAKEAFGYCDNMTSVTIPSTVKTIEYSAFSSCDGLTSVTFNGGVETIGESAFVGCTGLTAIDLPEGVKTISDYAFNECTKLATITLPSSLTEVGVDAFDLTAWSNSQPDGVLYLGTVVCGYKGTMPTATSIDIKDGTTLIANNAFYRKSNLVGVTFPSSVKVIGMEAFYSTNLLDCTVPNTVTSVGADAFYFVPNIAYSGTLTDAPWGALTRNGYVEGNFVYTDNTKKTLSACSTLAAGDITISSTVTTIGDWAFNYCDQITSVTIPEGVTTIGEGAFKSCYELQTVTIPSTVTSIGKDAFAYCTQIHSLTVPDEVATIDNNAFQQITNVIYNGKATGSPWGAKSVNGIVDGYLIYTDADKTTLLACRTDATGVITIPSSVTTIRENAFAACVDITSVEIPNTVTSIGIAAFGNVLNVVYSGEVMGAPWGARSLNGYAEGIFAYVDNTKETLITCSTGAKGDIIVPDGVTAIGRRAFRFCLDITSLTLPASVSALGDEVFSYSGITSITVLATTPPETQEGTFYDVNDNLTIHIPCGSLAAYTDKDCAWSEFTGQFVELFDYTLSVTSKDNAMGSVRITKEATCADNKATFEAIANKDYQFKQWSDGNTDNPRTVTVDENLSFEAQFVSAPTALETAQTLDLHTQNGRIICEGDFQIFDLLGRNVTRLNGSLNGVYIVKCGDKAQKVVVSSK